MATALAGIHSASARIILRIAAATKTQFTRSVLAVLACVTVSLRGKVIGLPSKARFHYGCIEVGPAAVSSSSVSSSPFLAARFTSALDDAPRVTRTTTGIHGDPINVGLIGTKDELIAAMLAAKWQPADPITFKSSVKLVQERRAASP